MKKIVIKAVLKYMEFQIIIMNAFHAKVLINFILIMSVIEIAQKYMEL